MDSALTACALPSDSLQPCAFFCWCSAYVRERVGGGGVLVHPSQPRLPLQTSISTRDPPAYPWLAADSKAHSFSSCGTRRVQAYYIRRKVNCKDVRARLSAHRTAVSACRGPSRAGHGWNWRASTGERTVIVSQWPTVIRMSASIVPEVLASWLERLRSAPSELLTKLRGAGMEQSRDDVRRLTFWRGVVAEFLGALFYVLLGCGASAKITSEETTSHGEQSYVPVIQGALAFGLGYAGIVHCIRNVSGGHVNPSVSFAALVTRKISVARALLYVVAQFLGSVLGAAILLGVTASGYRGKLGCTTLAHNMSAEQGFGVELFSTFLFVFAWFASFDQKRGKEGQTWAPFGVGMLLVAELMFAVGILQV